VRPHDAKVDALATEKAPTMLHLLGYWISPLAVGRVSFISAVTATMLALAFLVAIVCFA
jgi:hypothetical protein